MYCVSAYIYRYICICVYICVYTYIYVCIYIYIYTLSFVGAIMSRSTKQVGQASPNMWVKNSYILVGMPEDERTLKNRHR